MMQQPTLSKSTTMPPFCGLHWMPMPLQHGTPTRLQLLRSSQLRLQLGLLLMYATISLACQCHNAASVFQFLLSLTWKRVQLPICYDCFISMTHTTHCKPVASKTEIVASVADNQLQCNSEQCVPSSRLQWRLQLLCPWHGGTLSFLSRRHVLSDNLHGYS